MTDHEQGQLVAFIGAGTMAEAVIAGLVASGLPGKSILIGAHRAERDEQLANKYGLQVVSPQQAVRDAATVVIAVKPDVVPAVLDELGTHIPAGTVLVSVAAGVTTQQLQKPLADDVAVVRAMPNTPCLVGEGMTLLCAGSSADAAAVEQAAALMRACGKVLVIPESKMDAGTAVSGSGPAYLFYVVDAMIEAGVLLGLARPVATELAVQTLVGAGAMLRDTGEHPVILREKVSSPAGTTITALAELDDGGVRASFVRAMRACAERSAHLAASAE